MENKTALITGATAGIGRAAAVKFAQNNYDLILTGRRKERLEDMAASLSSGFKIDVITLGFDIRYEANVNEAVGRLADKWVRINVLVNNAGLALGLDPLQEGAVSDWDQMIDTNIKGLLYMSRAVAPLMIANGGGQIINIGSIAGKQVYPNGGVYCATKHAVDAITRSMRIDMLGKGIKVTQIAPGAVETEFSEVRFKGDETRAAKVYQGYQPLKPEDVAEVIYYVTTLPSHANIDDLLIMPTAQAGATYFDKQK